MLQLISPPTFLDCPKLHLSPKFRWPLSFPFQFPMSAAPPPPAAGATSLAQDLSSIGLGYAIAIALGFLVFFCTILIASYVCCRSVASRRSGRNPDFDSANENSVYLPRIVFVADDDEADSQSVVFGLDQAVINSYPKFFYSEGNGNGANDTVCSICLGEYRESEMLRMLPDCKHCFHMMCVDAWLKLNASCPVCRNSPLPTPQATPLQEVVPLSQYVDGRRRQRQ